MLTSPLFEKLLQIERSLGHLETATLRRLLIEAEAEAVRVQGEMIQVMQDMESLLELYERCARSGSSPAPARYGHARYEQGAEFTRETLAWEIAVVPPYARKPD
jgi:hypothetical protein